MLTVTFHGAAREVTGSLHMLEADGKRIALDCGLFQGKRSESIEKNQKFHFDPTSLHAVALSHAHIDHCGRLPMLVRNGFEGPIYSTPATRDLCALLLADSAHIQQEDAKYLNKKLAKKGEPPVSPLYEDEDATQAISQFHSISHGRWFHLTRRLKARYHLAGHMLGSSSIELNYSPPDSERPVRVVFTGDVGRPQMPILRDPSPFPECDYIISESTYGGREHPPAGNLKDQLGKVIRDTVARGGKIIIPAFSVGRTQVIVYYLHQLISDEAIEPIPIYVDSPLAVNATEVFRMHPELFDKRARDFLRQTGDILGSDYCTYVRDVEDSKAINKSPKPCVIISASGMCEAGRIRHHLKNNVGNGRNTVLIVGFQAAHTLGRRIVEKQKKINIFGQNYELKAQVATLNGFSGHADRDELVTMLKPHVPNCRGVMLVHGEESQMSQFKDTLGDAGFSNVVMPHPGECFKLDGIHPPALVKNS